VYCVVRLSQRRQYGNTQMDDPFTNEKCRYVFLSAARRRQVLAMHWLAQTHLLRTERGSPLPARCWAHSVPDCILVGGPLGPRGRNASRRHARRAGRPRLAPRGRGRLHVAVSTRGRGGHDGPEESETPRSLPRPGLGSTRLDSAGWGGDVHSPRQARERPPSVKRGGPCLGRLGDSEARNLDGTREKNRSSWDSWNGGSEDRLVQARGG
jgi:hypothetical protein